MSGKIRAENSNAICRTLTGCARCMKISINHQCHRARTPAYLSSEAVQSKRQAGVFNEWFQEAASSQNPSLSLSLSLSRSLHSFHLSLPQLEVWGKKAPGCDVLFHAPAEKWRLFQKSSKPKKSSMTMCLRVIFIVSVAARWEERGKDTTAIWKGGTAKEQLRRSWRAPPESLMLVSLNLKPHAINSVGCEEVKQREAAQCIQSAAWRMDGWDPWYLQRQQNIYSQRR